MENMQRMEHMIHEFTSYIRSRMTSSTMQLCTDLAIKYVKSCETPAYCKQEQPLVQATLYGYKTKVTKQSVFIADFFEGKKKSYVHVFI